MIFSKKKKPNAPQQESTSPKRSALSIQDLKKNFAEAYVTNYITFQSSLLECYDVQSFFDLDSPEEAQYLAKICLEYSIFLFEASIMFYSISSCRAGEIPSELVNHLYRAHLSCTSDSYFVYSCVTGEENALTDDQYFNVATSYYTGVMLKKTVPIHFAPFQIYSISDGLFSILNKLFDIFCNHCIYFLLTNEASIDSDSPLPLLDPLETLKMAASLRPFADFARDYCTALARFLKLD